MRGGTRKRGDTWTWYFDAIDPLPGSGGSGPKAAFAPSMRRRRR
jgi:hypothetical protein